MTPKKKHLIHDNQCETKSNLNVGDEDYRGCKCAFRAGYHVLNCNEYHAHEPPKCCDWDCDMCKKEGYIRKEEGD